MDRKILIFLKSNVRLIYLTNKKYLNYLNILIYLVLIQIYFMYNFIDN